MLRILFAVIMFTLVQTNIQAQQPVDSLKIALKSLDGTERIDQLNKIFRQYVCSIPDSAVVYYNSLQAELKVLDYERGEAETIKNFGTLMYCTGRIDSALFYFELAGQQALQNQIMDIAGAVYNNMGTMYRLKGDLDLATEKFQVCRNIGEQLKDTVLILSSYNGIGDIFKQTGYLDSALHYFLFAEKIALKSKNKRMLIPARLNIYTIYFKNNPEELDENEILETQVLATELNDQISVAAFHQVLGGFYYGKESYDQAIEVMSNGLKVLENISALYVSINLYQGIGNAYFKKGEYEKAIDYNNKGIEEALQGGMKAELLHLYGNNAANYLELKKYDRVIENANLAISFLDQTEALEFAPNIYGYLARANSEMGNYQKAYLAQKEHDERYLNFTSKKNDAQLAEMSAKYETEKKEAEIASLSQQATIQALQLKQKNFAILIGGIVVLLVSGFVFFYNRQKTFKTQKSQMELEQRFLRSQLNPHFISNALLAVQNFMLKNQTDAAVTYLSKFAKLMRETLENSRKEFIPLEDELAMLTNFMDVHKMRLNDSFEYKIHVSELIDPEVDTIPPMFVQPFVENAIEHGVSQLNGNGKIDLYFEKEEEYITITIKDNGGGYTQSVNVSKDHQSLSTTIIRERMEIFNQSLKRKIQLILDNVTNEKGEIEGAKVELKVPFSYI